LKAGDIANLAMGDIIMTDKGSEQRLQVSVEERPMFEGYAGLYKGHKAIRISKLIGQPKPPSENSDAPQPTPTADASPQEPS
jgi:flagellar motor switch protein FliM